MALDTYTGLKDSILNWLARPGDPLVAPTVPDMIIMFEEEARDRLKTRFAETPVTLTPDPHSTTLTLPDDFAELREAWVDVNNAGSGRQPLFFHEPHNLDTQVWACPGSTYAFTIEGLKMRFVGDSGDDPQPIHLNYWQGVPALSDTVTTNWLLRQYPSLYLFGSMSFAEAFIGDDERIGGWVQFRDATLERIARADRKARYTGGPLVIQPDSGGGSVDATRIRR